jgi:hypothetical protein
MRGRNQFLAGLASAFLTLALPVICRANTITVNSLADPGASGICALRDAITASNIEAAVNGCAAGTGNDAIVFSVTGTITTVSTLPEIANTLTIKGQTANPPTIAISGALLHQVIVVNEGATLSLSYITIENGTVGGAPGNAGGVENDGTLTITSSTFSGNFVIDGLGGGIYNSGTLTVTNSTFSGNSAGFGGGGGIFNNAKLTVTNTTFSGDNAPGFGFGGGILSGGTLAVTNSTFADDGAAVYGGGIYNDGTLTVTDSTFSGNGASVGGGIYNDGTLTTTNSTFSENIAGGTGGGIYNGDTLTVTNSTFAGNRAVIGGGITNGSILDSELITTADVKGTILTTSTGGNCASGESGSGVSDGGFNLDDDGSCDFASGTTSDADIALDPAGLENNGGPTQTIALESDSVAINAIPVASCQYVNVNPCTNPPTSSASGPLVCDQRGEPRPGSGESACAIGAFEPQSLTEFAEFDTGLIVFPRQFAAGGSFTLGAGAVFNPPTQAVTVTIASDSFGPLVVTIPPSHFTFVKGQYKYSGTIGGLKYGVTIFAPVDDVYQFTFAAFGVDVTGIINPVSVTLQIGSNIGTDDDVAAAIL